MRVSNMQVIEDNVKYRARRFRNRCNFCAAGVAVCVYLPGAAARSARSRRRL